MPIHVVPLKDFPLWALHHRSKQAAACPLLEHVHKPAHFPAHWCTAAARGEKLLTSAAVDLTRKIKHLQNNVTRFWDKTVNSYELVKSMPDGGIHPDQALNFRRFRKTPSVP